MTGTLRTVGVNDDRSRGFSLLSLKAKIVGGFGLLLMFIAATTVMGILLLQGVDAQFHAYRAAQARTAQTVNLDLLMTKVRVRVNQWLRSMNPQFAKQADELLADDARLLAEMASAIRSTDEQKLIGDMDRALKAYVFSWHVVQDLYAQESKIHSETIPAHFRAIRGALVPLRSQALAARANDAASLIAEALDSVNAASSAAARYQASLDKGALAEVHQEITSAVKKLTAARPALTDSRQTTDIETALASLAKWSDTFAQAVKTAEIRVARLASWTKDEGEVMATAAAALQELEKRETSRVEELMSSTIADSKMIQLLGTAFIFVTGVTLSILLARSMTAPLGRLTRAMTALADGDRDVQVRDASRRDEIGRMAQAVQIFKDNANRVLELEAEQKHAQARAGEQRKCKGSRASSRLTSARLLKPYRQRPLGSKQRLAL